MSAKISVLIGTRKGAFVLSSTDNRRTWQISDPIFLGHIVHHLVPDPRNPKHLVMAAKAGHLGPTVYHSSDAGKTWTESTKPPQFPKAGETVRTDTGASNNVEAEASRGADPTTNANAASSPDGKTKGRVVDLVFWISPGHESEPNRWYAGTAPPGIFVSDDNGATWTGQEGMNEHPNYKEWFTEGATPAGQLVHSIRIDPRDKNHMYCGVSIGGVFETTDAGKTWTPLNKGCAADYMPDPNVEVGHDPHCFVSHPANPDRLYQQNHCGIYRMDRPSNEWIRIGNNMPKEIGDIGFPIVVHPRNPDTAWVFPMDGSDVWPRTSPGGKPALYVTTDAGSSWQRQDNGLPEKDAYFTVKRQAMCGDSEDPVGLYFGTSQGEVWGSSDGGQKWRCLVSYLPEIYSLSIMVSSD